LLAALAAWLLAGCNRVHINVSPPPAVPQPAPVPDRPELQAEPSEFTPALDAEFAGDSRLWLKSKSVGLASIADQGEIADLHEQLIRALLQAEFKTVIDLQPSHQVFAAHASRVQGADVRLYGMMADLMKLARVSQAQYVVTGEVLEATAVKRHLPIRFWYDESALATYQGQVDSYLESRTALLGELGNLEKAYSVEYMNAENEYREAMPFWQKPVDAISTPEEKEAYLKFLDDVEGVETAMPGALSSAEELEKQAGQRREKRTVDVLVAKARFKVMDPSNGDVKAVLDILAEATNPQELTRRLAASAAAELGER